MCPSPMFSELQADHRIPRQRTTENPVRLNPVPARNTLLTIVFFSALAAAILYWIFFPPATPETPERSPTQNAQPAERK
jgi:hypothetical protein